MARDRPISRPCTGRKVKRMPLSLALSMVRLSWYWPANTVRFQGPIQLSHLEVGARSRLRLSHTAGMGRALLERIRLDCQPGPHQRSMAPAPDTQLPRRSEERRVGKEC